jgi:hypothetical protein
MQPGVGLAQLPIPSKEVPCGWKLLDVDQWHEVLHFEPGEKVPAF